MNNLSTELIQRSGSKCELCGAAGTIFPYVVAPKTGNSVDEQVALCKTCHSQIEDPATRDNAHWRILVETIWSDITAVQVLSYRILRDFGDAAWAQDILGMVFLDDETQEWADADIDGGIIHRDSNGVVLKQGDNVIVIKDLDVKGANLVAKRGLTVRRITLVKDNAEQIEGRVNDQHIVLLTQFVKKV